MTRVQLKPTNKYGNKKVQIDGYTFDSKKEAERYKELKLAEQAGDIIHFEVHREYSLCCPSPIIGEDFRYVATYIADFCYYDRHAGRPLHFIVEDVKSPATRKLPAYRLKKKWLQAQYDLTITEV